MIIMHVDMNSYFATVEQQSNPFLRGKPICVAGKGSSERTVCAAASIEAKKFGIKSGCPVWEAKNLCPDIVVVRADYDKYLFVSRQVFQILESYSPQLEIFSIDEAFLDLTGIAKNIDDAKNIANDIKTRIRTEIGDYLKCSIGIAPNKLMAKLASEMQKPDGLTIINKNNLDAVLAKTPIQDACGIGPRIGNKLDLIGIKTLADLGNCDTTRLTHFFGINQAKILKLMGQGKDNGTVNPHFALTAEKSFGHSYTLPRNMFKLEDALKVLLKLSEKVGRRLRKAHFFGRTISVYVRFLDFSGINKRTTLPSFINDGLAIYRIGESLLKDITKPIRAIGISISNLERDVNLSQPILPGDQRQEQILKATDQINDKFGEFTIYEATLAKIKDRIQNIPDGRAKRF